MLLFPNLTQGPWVCNATDGLVSSRVLKKHPARRYRDVLPFRKGVKHLNNGEKGYPDVPFTQPRMQKQKSHFLLFELEKSKGEAEQDKGPVGETEHWR